MENENVKYRNMTISLKVAADEKIMLRRLAEKHSVTLSEFMYNLVMCFANQYDYIGMLTPKEEKLAENLRKVKKQNSKLTAEIENADFRVQMEMEKAAKAINAKDEFAYQLKEQKAINADQLEELNRLKELNLMLGKSNNKFKRTSIDNQLTSIAAGVFGLFTGFAFKR